jgi:hypothetical protein
VRESVEEHEAGVDAGAKIGSMEVGGSAEARVAAAGGGNGG